MKADIHRLIELQRLLVLFSQVERRNHRQHDGKFIQENDTEHSYNLAMTAWYLTGFFPELDRDKIIRYALAHDIVEVHAGDTYVYAEESELASKKEREEAALTKLEQDWSDFGDMISAIKAYEERLDAESRFVYALDKIMPVMLIYIGNGYTWQQEGISVAMLHAIKAEKVKLSPEILPYFEQLHALLLSRPDLIKAH